MKRVLFALLAIAAFVACADSTDGSDVQSGTVIDEAPTDPTVPVRAVRVDEGVVRNARPNVALVTVTAEGAPAADLWAGADAGLPPHELPNLPF